MTPGFHGVFCKTTIIKQLRKGNESKIEKIQSKTVEFLYEYLRVVVSVCVYTCACMGNVCDDCLVLTDESRLRRPNYIFKHP